MNTVLISGIVINNLFKHKCLSIIEYQVTASDIVIVWVNFVGEECWGVFGVDLLSIHHFYVAIF